jgi:hypothetical protein
VIGYEIDDRATGCRHWNVQEPGRLAFLEIGELQHHALRYAQASFRTARRHREVLTAR